MMKLNKIGFQIVFTLVSIFLLQIGEKAYADNPDLECTASNGFHFYFVDKYTAQFSNIPDRVIKGNMLCYDLWPTCAPGNTCAPTFTCHSTFDSKYEPRYYVKFEFLEEKPSIIGTAYRSDLNPSKVVSKITCRPRQPVESEPLSAEEAEEQATLEREAEEEEQRNYLLEIAEEQEAAGEESAE